MSRENVELVRRFLEAWSRGDVDGALAFLAAEFEYRPSGLFPGMAPVYQGHDGYKRFWSDFNALWEEIEFVPERLVDHGDRVVVFGRFKARGREGITVERELGAIFTVRGGLGVRIETYPSGEHALEAAGLHEQVRPRSNLDVVRSWIAAFNGRDLEAMLAVTHPNFEFRTSGAFPGP